jgi:hypothetical protein
MLYRNIEHFQLNMLNHSNDILKIIRFIKKTPPFFALITSIGLFSKSKFKIKVDNMLFVKALTVKSLLYVYLKSDLYLLFKINQIKSYYYYYLKLETQ